ncbi:MAG: hypothetical protein WC619_04665 [Patescibacteria group bacterium]
MKNLLIGCVIATAMVILTAIAISILYKSTGNYAQIKTTASIILSAAIVAIVSAVLSATEARTAIVSAGLAEIAAAIIATTVARAVIVNADVVEIAAVAMAVIVNADVVEIAAVAMAAVAVMIVIAAMSLAAAMIVIDNFKKRNIKKEIIFAIIAIIAIMNSTVIYFIPIII